jgi:hypothetical protein
MEICRSNGKIAQIREPALLTTKAGATLKLPQWASKRLAKIITNSTALFLNTGVIYNKLTRPNPCCSTSSAGLALPLHQRAGILGCLNRQWSCSCTATRVKQEARCYCYDGTPLRSSPPLRAARQAYVPWVREFFFYLLQTT